MYTLSIYTLFTDYLHTIYRLSTHYLHTIYWISNNYLHTIYRLSTHYLHTIYNYLHRRRSGWRLSWRRWAVWSPASTCGWTPSTRCSPPPWPGYTTTSQTGTTTNLLEIQTKIREDFTIKEKASTWGLLLIESTYYRFHRCEIGMQAQRS